MQSYGTVRQTLWESEAFLWSVRAYPTWRHTRGMTESLRRRIFCNTNSIHHHESQFSTFKSFDILPKLCDVIYSSPPSFQCLHSASKQWFLWQLAECTENLNFKLRNGNGNERTQSTMQFFVVTIVVKSNSIFPILHSAFFSRPSTSTGVLCYCDFSSLLRTENLWFVNQSDSDRLHFSFKFWLDTFNFVIAFFHTNISISHACC